MSSSAPEEWFRFEPVPATVTILPPPPRRLGVASMVLGLLPVATLVVVMLGYPLAAMWEEGMFAGLTWLFIGCLVALVSTLFAGGPAIILGIAAIRQHRGFEFGVAGVVFGSVFLALGLLFGLVLLAAT